MHNGSSMNSQISLFLNINSRKEQYLRPPEYSGGLIFVPEIPVFPIIFIVIMIRLFELGAISGACRGKL